jgi:hypothetical protein
LNHITSDKLLTMVNISRPTLFKRLKRAFNSNGVITFPDAGTFFVRKSATPGKPYEILPMNYNPETVTDADIVKGILEQLKNMRGVVCEDCKAQVVDKVIKQLEAK